MDGQSEISVMEASAKVLQASLDLRRTLDNLVRPEVDAKPSDCRPKMNDPISEIQTTLGEAYMAIEETHKHLVRVVERVKGRVESDAGLTTAMRERPPREFTGRFA